MLTSLLGYMTKYIGHYIREGVPLEDVILIHHLKLSRVRDEIELLSGKWQYRLFDQVTGEFDEEVGELSVPFSHFTSWPYLLIGGTQTGNPTIRVDQHITSFFRADWPAYNPRMSLPFSANQDNHLADLIGGLSHDIPPFPDNEVT
jgi:hypothetical protein